MGSKRLVEKVTAWAASQAQSKEISAKPRPIRHTLAEALFHTKRRAGRPLKPEVQQLGREAAKLRKAKRLSYGQIAMRLCPQRNEPHHRCKKACADRIRQAAKPFLT